METDTVQEKHTFQKLSVLMVVSIVVSIIPAIVRAFPYWKDLEGSYFHQPLLLALTVYLVVKEWKSIVEAGHHNDNGNLLLKLFILMVGSYFYCSITVLVFPTLLSLAVPAYVGAIVYFLYGQQLFRKVVFYLALLSLSFPFPRLIISVVEWFLQKGTIRMSTILLSIFDRDTVCSGKTIISFGESVRVGLTCSGINSFLILVPLVVLAYRFYYVSPMRMGIVALCLPFSVVVFNAIRVSSMFFASPWIEFSSAIKHFHTIGPVFFFLNAWFILFMLTSKMRFPSTRSEERAKKQ